MNLIERHQDYLAKRGISAAQIAKAYGQRPPRRPKVAAGLKHWILQARNASTLAGLQWQIPDEVMLAALGAVKVAELPTGIWVLARWVDQSHRPGNSVLIQKSHLDDLNKAANRAIQRALLATMFASRHAIPVGATPPAEPTIPLKTRLGSKPVIPKLESTPVPVVAKTSSVRKPQQLSQIDFHFMEQRAKGLGFDWALTGAEFKALLATAPALTERWVCLYPRNAAKSITKDNVQWGFLDSLDTTPVKDYQIVLDALAETLTLNPTIGDPLWEIAGHPAPEPEPEPLTVRKPRIAPNYDEFLAATPDKIVDWFQCTLEQWDLIPFEIRKAYVWFRHWCQNTKKQHDGTMTKAHGCRMTLTYFAESIVGIGGLSRIGSGSGQLLPIRINLDLPYQPGNVVFMTRKMGLILQGQLNLPQNKVPDRHARGKRDLKKGIAGVYYRDEEGQFYFPTSESVLVLDLAAE